MAYGQEKEGGLRFERLFSLALIKQSSANAVIEQPACAKPQLLPSHLRAQFFEFEETLDA